MQIRRRTHKTIFLAFILLVLSACEKKTVTHQYPPGYYSRPPANSDARFLLDYAPADFTGYKYNYFNDGTIKSEGYYENGVPQGNWKFYYPNGTLEREGLVENEMLQLYWKFYYDNGTLKEEGSYTDNLRTGLWIFYHPNGTLQSSGQMLNDYPTGEWKEYNDAGVQINTAYYK